jgi:hypothetical protein
MEAGIGKQNKQRHVEFGVANRFEHLRNQKLILDLKYNKSKVLDL